ncbi:MAG: hypothetical protein ACK559_35475, partial [bacterium]
MVRGISRRAAEDSCSGAVAVMVVGVVTPQDEILNVALLAEELVPRQSRGYHVRHIGGQAVARPSRHRLGDPLGGVVLEAQVVGGQLLLGLLGGEGELLAVQQVHVAPQRALLGGGGGPTLPIEAVS